MSNISRRTEGRTTETLEVKITSGDPNELGKAVLGIAVILGVAYLAYLATVHFIIPVMGMILFVGMAGISGVCLFKPTREIVEDRSVSFLAAYTALLKKEHPDMTEESAYGWMLGLTAVGIGVYALLAAVVAGYAFDPHFQRVPVNYIGMAYFVVIVASIVDNLRSFLKLPKAKTEPYTPRSLYTRIRIKSLFALGVAYPLAVFAVKFGVL